MEKISPFSLYVINRIIYRSYVIGLLQEKLSSALGKHSGYVNNVRNKNNDAIFAPADYQTIAKALNWETHDLLPSSDFPYSDGTLVDKVVFTLENQSDAKEVLIGMIENKYFDTMKSLDDVYDHLYLIKDSIDAKKRKVILEILTKLVDGQKLRLKDGKYSV